MSASYVSGQTNYFKHRSLTRGKDFLFPVFYRDSNLVTTGKINQLLQLSELALLNGYQTNDIFELISIDDGTIYGGKTEISYEILSNTPKLVSIKFNQTSCGATCAYWVRYYNFNSGNGDLMQLKDLFTNEGFNRFTQKLISKRAAKFKAEVLKVEKAQRKDLLNVTPCFENDDLHDYYIRGTSIFVDGENCLTKNEKFFGLDMATKINLSEFKNDLNKYGKAIFGITAEKVLKYRSNELPQLFEGTIGSSLKILLVLNRNYENKMRGVYAYLKHGTGIYLEGELNIQQLFLTEKIKNYRPPGYISAVFDGKNIQGTWTDSSQTKKMKLVAKRR